MLNYRIHDNGWTVIIEDFDLRQATQSQANIIAKLLATNTVIVIRGQKLTPHDEINFCSKIGVVEDWTKRLPQGGDALNGFLVKNGNNKVIRVTGELDEHGRPGLFGHVSDLDWHANQTANEWRHPIVWLYGVKGTAGSRTSWLNNIASYNDLDQQDKDYYKSIRMINGYKQGAYSESHFGKPIDINFTYKPNLVHTNIAGVTGLYFPFLQIHQIDGMDEDQSREFITKLQDHVLQEKYMYHHDWHDGDVVIAEQWLGVHKRWRFDAIDARVLHRICMGFENCDLDQEEST
jgi:taurine dioxygenase